MILVTGGAGFIGSNFVLDWLASSNECVVNVDKLTYAGNTENLRQLDGDSRHVFIKGDIADIEFLKDVFRRYNPRAVINFAAESHVDRSINGPEEFISTNILGTYRLLEACRDYWKSCSGSANTDFRLLHVSTDEVYGSLSADDPPFAENSPFAPNSPYSASKAASDHLVRAWWHTYGLPTLTTNCSNNYGPLQFPEKLIPLMIVNALASKPLPIYGDGTQIRDWLYVTDHCRAIRLVLERGEIGETYNVGGASERTNMQVVRMICEVLDEIRPRHDGSSYLGLISHVIDRPGHDRRYAIDCRKIENELGWKVEESFQTGLRKTIEWYLHNQKWVESIQTGTYRNASAGRL
ncbi:MAG: dTDP-glucose 4,6-dehydratase [Planctomycetes bacterium]|nr:dTDP-glucose 4,6-dehydratase [Planctomycetota bacterium]MBM4229463.1 dTDP-glucose 4,6-dehydratase [Gammaproteobacteria bacterium]